MNSILEEEHTSLLQFMYACPVGLAELAADGFIRMINPLAMNLLMPIARGRGMTNLFDITENIAPELRNLADRYAPAQGTVCDGHRIFVSPSQKESDYEPNVIACTLVKLQADRYVIAIVDVSKQVAQERRLKQAETWFASLLDSVNDFAVVSLDSEGLIEAITPSVVRQTGLSELQLLGRTLDILGVPGQRLDALSVAEQIALARRDGWHLHECSQSRGDESPYWCQRLIAVRSEGGDFEERKISGYTVVLRDVTQQKSDTTKLTRMLRTDFLTGAYNRSYFFEVAERETLRSKRYGQSLALIAIDLDHFKEINDLHGHGVGDEVLREFVKACSPSLRPDDLFARLGGEEFAVLLPSTDLEEAARIAERLRTTIASITISVKDISLRLTASLGCSEMRQKAATVTELLADADEALYRAKRLGRDRVVLWGQEPLSSVLQ